MDGTNTEQRREGGPGATRPDRGAGHRAAPVGHALRRYRVRAGLTQEELAERSGYSANYVGKLERGEREAPPSALDRLATVLGLGDEEVAALQATRDRRADGGPETRPLTGRSREIAEISQCVAEARRLGTWMHGVGAPRVWGMVEARRGNDDGAVSAYEEGLRRARAMPFSYAEMQLLHAYGLLERQRGDTTAAQTKLTEALSFAERLGATRDAEILRRVTRPTPSSSPGA